VKTWWQGETLKSFVSGVFLVGCAK